MKRICCAAILLAMLCGAVYGLTPGLPPYEGSGGAGMVVSVEKPEGSGLAESDGFILDFIQYVIIGDFKKYTAVEVREADSSIKGTVYCLVRGKITREGGTYRLEFTVTDVTTNVRKASSVKTGISAGEVLNESALNAAFGELLEQLNIVLTSAGKAALANPSQSDINAALNMARGSAAEAGGNTIEILNYYYNAVSYDPSLTEASARIASFSASLAAGDSGSQIKGDIAARDSWKKILDDFEEFYRIHPPFELSYLAKPEQYGKSDYDSRTAVLQFNLIFQEAVAFQSMQKVLKSVLEGLDETGNRELWGMSGWPYRTTMKKSRKYKIVAELVNNRGESLDTQTFEVSSRFYFTRNAVRADSTRGKTILFRAVNADTELTPDMVVKITKIDGMETEQAQQDGFVKVTAVEELPKKKTRNLAVFLTRSPFN
jgi:hypothetical protein